MARLYRDHVGFVFRSVRHLGVPEPLMEDVVHDVFIVVHRRLHEFEGRGTIRSWLYGITRRVVLHAHRSRFRAERRLALICEPMETPDVEARLAALQALHVVEHFVQDLAPDNREIFVLSEVEGFAATEVARAVSLNLNTVYSRIRSLRKKFRRHAAAAGVGPGGQP